MRGLGPEIGLGVAATQPVAGAGRSRRDPEALPHLACRGNPLDLGAGLSLPLPIELVTGRVGVYGVLPDQAERPPDSNPSEKISAGRAVSSERR